MVVVVAVERLDVKCQAWRCWARGLEKNSRNSSVSISAELGRRREPHPPHEIGAPAETSRAARVSGVSSAWAGTPTRSARCPALLLPSALATAWPSTMPRSLRGEAMMEVDVRDRTLGLERNISIRECRAELLQHTWSGNRCRVAFMS